MYKLTQPLFLICETPLHAGSGDSLGIVDLPIQRERHTSFPKIESSSLKGALREAFEENTKGHFSNWNDNDVKVHRIFGYDDSGLKPNDSENLKKHFKSQNGDDTSQFSGCLAVTDARLLLFPVKSMKGVFVWITCPQVLSRLEKDLKMTQTSDFTIPSLKIEDGDAIVADRNKVAFGDHIVLEEFAFKAKENVDLKKFAKALAEKLFVGDELPYWNELLQTNLVVLGNNEFRDFVNMSTEVVTRTKIDNETGTVADGALFTEEYLPTDSVMYSLAAFSDEFTKKTNGDKMIAEIVAKFFQAHLKPIFQLGGNATIGKGLLRTRLL